MQKSIGSASSNNLDELAIKTTVDKAFSLSSLTASDDCNGLADKEHIANKAIDLDNVFLDSNYISEIFYNSFRRGKYFIKDVLDLRKKLLERKITIVYLLEKTKGSILSAKLSKVKKIYSYGLGFQKYLS